MFLWMQKYFTIFKKLILTELKFKFWADYQIPRTLSLRLMPAEDEEEEESNLDQLTSRLYVESTSLPDYWRCVVVVVTP